MGRRGIAPRPSYLCTPAPRQRLPPLLLHFSTSLAFPVPLFPSLYLPPPSPPYPLFSFSLFLRSPSPFSPSLPTSEGEFSPREVCAVEPLDARVERLRGGRWGRHEGVLWVIFYTFVRLCTEYKWYKGKDLQPRNTGAYADQSLTFPPLKQDAIHGVLAMASG